MGLQRLLYFQCICVVGVLLRCKNMYVGYTWCAVNALELFLDVLLSHEVHLSIRYFLTVLADPYSVYSAGGRLGRARAASRRGLLLSIF